MEPLRHWEDLVVGSEIEVGPCVIRAEDIRRYLELIGDRNPVHDDASFARTTQLARPIVPGVLLFGFASARVREAVGAYAVVAARFGHYDYLAPCHPDEPFAVRTAVVAKEPVDQRRGTVEIMRRILSAADGRVLAIGREGVLVLRRGES